MTKIKTKDGTVLVGDKVNITTIGTEKTWIDFYDFRGNCVKENLKDYLSNTEIESIESIEINGKLFVAKEQ